VPLDDPCREPFALDAEDPRICTRGPPVGADGYPFFVTRSSTMMAILRRAEAVSRNGAPVVILGETGTGKEVLARAIHRASPRAAQPFVPVNCGAIPGDLLESELFGHVRGAFSGAVADRVGLFHAAQGGTLMLDEVADLPLGLQVKLLRVLQGGEVRRLGANRPQSVDVRVIAATHKDLVSLVRDGLFRADLYFRLKVFSFHMPALRDRREDILPMARRFLELEQKASVRISPVAEAALLRHRWPGNVRELANAMRHGATVLDGDVLELHHLPEEMIRATEPPASPRALVSLERVEREHILAVLAACDGVQSVAARVLGIARNTLGRKLRAYGKLAGADGGEAPKRLDPEVSVSRHLGGRLLEVGPARSSRTTRIGIEVGPERVEDGGTLSPDGRPGPSVPIHRSPPPNAGDRADPLSP
jgi:two-component system response regulator HydG